MVVNERAAALLWPDENPLGHEFTLGTRLGQEGVPAGGTVVGVAGNVRDHGPMPTCATDGLSVARPVSDGLHDARHPDDEANRRR